MTEFLLQSEACLVETRSRRGAGLLREGIMGLREQVVASEVLAFKTDYTAVELRGPQTPPPWVRLVKNSTGCICSTSVI